jgi:4-aminobutyrate aminotransferase
MAAVAANIEIIRDEKIVEHVAELGSYFGEQLAELVERHPCAASLSGRGFAWAIELVKDPETGEKWSPLDRWYTPGIDPAPEFNPSQFIADECEKDNILLFSFLTNTVTLAPPLLLSHEELEVALSALERAFSALDDRCPMGG